MTARSLQAVSITWGFMLLVGCASASRLTQATYVGCFHDATNNVRDLNGLVGITQFGAFTVQSFSGVSAVGLMSQELCNEICSLGGFRYFGVQFASECYCGDTYGSQGADSESVCNYKCSGNVSQICGASSRNSVYALNYLNQNVFRSSPRTSLQVTAAFTQPTYRSVAANDALQCLFQCSSSSSSCQAVIFSQSHLQCHLLRFAAVPSALTSSDGDFFARS